MFLVEDGQVYRLCPSDIPSEKKPRFHRNIPTNPGPTDRPDDLDIEREEKIKYKTLLKNYKSYERSLTLGK